MDAFVYGLLLATAASVALVIHRAERRFALRAGGWQEIARRTELELIVPSASGPVGVNGSLDGIEVSARSELTGGRMTLTAAFVDQAAKRLGLRRGSEDAPRAGVLIGDPRFDPLVFVDGDELRALAVLDVDTRKKAVRLINHFGMTLADGILRHDESPKELDPDRVVSLIDLMRGFARSLMLEDRDIARRLFDNAKVEPLSAVRNRMLQMLFEYAPKSEEAKQGLAMLDEVAVDPVVTIAGYLARGSEGATRLLEVVEDSPSETHRAYAARLLVRAYRGQFIDTLLDVVMDDPASEVRRGVVLGIGEAGRHRYEGRLGGVGARILDEGGDERALLWSLERVESADTEALVLRLLESDDPGIRRRAARLLGQVGGRDAVLPLKSAAQKRLLDRELKRQIDASLLRIRERLGAEGAGGLSVHEPEAQSGQLSLDDEGAEGALSYAVEPGRLEFSTPRPGGGERE